MDQQLVEQLRQRIAELKAARERHAQQAQREDYGYAAAIGELEQLLGTLTALVPAIDDGDRYA
jgi:hypothetical protein